MGEGRSSVLVCLLNVSLLLFLDAKMKDRYVKKGDYASLFPYFLICF